MPFDTLVSRSPQHSSPATDLVPYHPLANTFPLIEGKEFFAFCNDIKSNGQQDPIILLDGKILDGRNRYRALMQLGINPVFEDYSGDTPLEFVLSKNIYRRQLTIAQRSIIAAELFFGDADNNYRLHDDNAEGGAMDPSRLRPGIGLSHAASLLGISERSVSSATRVARSGVDELLNVVKSGKVKISVAEYISKLDGDHQRRVCAKGVKSIRETAKQMREQRCKKDHPQESDAPETDVKLPPAGRAPMTEAAEALTQFVRLAHRRGAHARDVAEQISRVLTSAGSNDTRSLFFALQVATIVRDRLLQNAIFGRP